MIVTLSLSLFTPTLWKDIGIVNLGTISMKSDYLFTPVVRTYMLKIRLQNLDFVGSFKV